MHRTPSNLDCSVDVEGEFLSTCSDELIDLFLVIQLCVTVEENSGVICAGQATLMQGVQILCQLFDSLSVQELHMYKVIS